jgi:hypothetical protein
VPPTYRDRLRIEGLTLAACGALGTAVLVRYVEAARRKPHDTAIQLVLFTALLRRFGPRSTARTLERARPVAPAELGTGEPTPLWQLPVIVAGESLFLAKLAGPISERLWPLVPRRWARKAGWDAALRATIGTTIAGLFQAVFVARQVAEREAADGRTYYRVRGSRLLSGTNLGYPSPAPASPATAPSR